MFYKLLTLTLVGPLFLLSESVFIIKVLMRLSFDFYQSLAFAVAVCLLQIIGTLILIFEAFSGDLGPSANPRLW